MGGLCGGNELVFLESPLDAARDRLRVQGFVASDRLLIFDSERDNCL